MCKSCDIGHEEQWIKESSERIDARRVLGDLIGRAQPVLDFYYAAQIEGTKREAKIKLDLEAAINNAKKYHAEL